MTSKNRSFKHRCETTTTGAESSVPESLPLVFDEPLTGYRPLWFLRVDDLGMGKTGGADLLIQDRLVRREKQRRSAKG